MALSLSGGEDSLACDLSSEESVNSLDLAPDFIVHCASSGRGGEESYRAVYLEGCRHLIARFPGVPLLFTSSTSVYAQADGSVVTEQSLARPDRETGKILRETEDLVLSAGGSIARLAGIYGPARSVILKKFLNGETVIEEDGQRYLNQIHRDDAAAAIVHLSKAAPGIYNVADSTPLTQLECHEQLSHLFRRPLPPRGPRDLNRKRGWTHKQVSNAKLRDNGWMPRYPSFLDAAEEIAATLI